MLLMAFVLLLCQTAKSATEISTIPGPAKEPPPRKARIAPGRGPHTFRRPHANQVQRNYKLM